LIEVLESPEPSTMVANTKWGSDEKTLLHLYHSLIRSKLEYGTEIYIRPWHSNKNLKILTKLTISQIT